jgi:hypothetical protein
VPPGQARFSGQVGFERFIAESFDPQLLSELQARRFQRSQAFATRAA